MRPVRKYSTHAWSSSAKLRFKLLDHVADEGNRLSPSISHYKDAYRFTLSKLFHIVFPNRDQHESVHPRKRGSPKLLLMQLCFILKYFWHFYLALDLVLVLESIFCYEIQSLFSFCYFQFPSVCRNLKSSPKLCSK